MAWMLPLCLQVGFGLAGARVVTVLPACCLWPLHCALESMTRGALQVISLCLSSCGSLSTGTIQHCYSAELRRQQHTWSGQGIVL